MDKIEKALRKLSPRERQQVKQILKKLKNNNLNGLDLKKLKGRDDIFRVRKGDMRIIYKSSDQNDISVLAIERRSDTTYNF